MGLFARGNGVYNGSGEEASGFTVSYGDPNGTCAEVPLLTGFIG